MIDGIILSIGVVLSIYSRVLYSKDESEVVWDFGGADTVEARLLAIVADIIGFALIIIPLLHYLGVIQI
jgi:hypothetical protein